MNRMPVNYPSKDRTLPDYRVRRSSRARHVSLNINRVDGLVVVIPYGFDERLIPGLLHEQRNWIEARLQRLERTIRQPDIDAGSSRPGCVALAAVDERWQIAYRENGSATVRITECDDGVLRATGAAGNEAELRAALRRWLKRRAQRLLTPRLAELASLHGFDYARLTIRHQRSRWGSCSTRGTISLNAKLMFLTPELVDHVLLHELCHTQHPHHGREFHERLAGIVPDHRRQRAALREAWATMPDWALR